MNFGTNSLLIKEVMDLIKKRNILSSNQITNQGIVIIHDFNQAEMYAWSQDSDEVETVWEFVKSKETESIVDKIYNQGLVSEQEEIFSFFSNIENYSKDFIPFEYIDINEEVEGDLTMCALNRLVNGKTNNFYEKLFEVYQSGAWPCGWEGQYPKGNIIAFVPPTK